MKQSCVKAAYQKPAQSNRRMMNLLSAGVIAGYDHRRVIPCEGVT